MAGQLMAGFRADSRGPCFEADGPFAVPPPSIKK